jgi:hypothetical protein
VANRENMPRFADNGHLLVRKRALDNGRRRSQGVRDRVRAAMRAIAFEMEQNLGIYPQNGGAVSAAEVARRAGVHPTTFFTAKQIGLGKEVREWLTSIRKSKVVGRVSVRRELSMRVADWKRLYEGLAQSHRDTELELQQAEAELAQTQKSLLETQRENARLKSALNAIRGENTIPFRSR